MSDHTLFLLITLLLGAILVVLCGILVIVKKAANETITALQALYDDLRKGRSS